MGLDDARIQGFLATKEVAVLATVQANGSPLAMAMWFLHAPASLTMISVADTQKVRNLHRDPRVSVVAEAVTAGGETRGVAVQGRAEFRPDGPERRALIDCFSREVPRPAAPLERQGHAGQPGHVHDRALARAELGARMTVR